MSEKCRNNKHNNNSDNPLTSRRTDGGKDKKRSQLKFKAENKSKIQHLQGFFSGLNCLTCCNL